MHIISNQYCGGFMQSNSKIRRVSNLDKIIGANIRKIRQSKLVSQMALSEELDISFQQLQKYEKGVNRVSASKLFLISEYLKVPVSDFIYGSDLAGVSKPTKVSNNIEEFVKLFSSIPDKNKKAVLKTLISQI